MLYSFKGSEVGYPIKSSSFLYVIHLILSAQGPIVTKWFIKLYGCTVSMTHSDFNSILTTLQKEYFVLYCIVLKESQILLYLYNLH